MDDFKTKTRVIYSPSSSKKAEKGWKKFLKSYLKGVKNEKKKT